MSTISATLTDQHRACDDLFAAAENSAAEGDLSTAVQSLERFVADTESHFQREEQVLFPAFEQRTGQTAGPTMIMRREHEQMRALFTELSASLGQNDKDRFLGLCETLLMLMQQHNAKEEQILYPMSDQVLGDQATNLIERFSEI